MNELPRAACEDEMESFSGRQVVRIESGEGGDRRLWRTAIED